MEATIPSWDHMKSLLDARSAIPAMQKSGGAVEYWREWNDSRKGAVWTKTYRSSGGHQLDAFNQAEIEILMQLAMHKVPNTYRSALIERIGTPMGTVSNGRSTTAQYTIKTDDAGPTLEDWLNAPVTSQASHNVQAHCLVIPENFLYFIHSLLSVLESVHANNYVHCDLHPGNIALPIRLIEQKPDVLSIDLLWEKLTLIDFGYSINRHKPPQTTLPFRREGEGTRISPHLANILSDIESQTKSALQGSERWDEIWLSPAFWQRWQGSSPLAQFKNLDWREDLYQVGCLLADIRDGTGMASQLGGRTVQESPVRAVNQIIDQLPEQLKTWGLGAGTPTPELPHRGYINHISEALAKARQDGRISQSKYHLRQSDYPAGRNIGGGQSFVRLSAVSNMAAPAQKHQVAAEQLDLQPVPPPQATPFSVTRTGIPNKKFGISLPILLPLPSGSFRMGSCFSNTTQPVHTVHIQPPHGLVLVVSRHAISRAQWVDARRHNPDLYLPPEETQVNGQDLPMTNISWHDCQAYIDTLNHLADLHRQPKELRFRLLSESEWEYAARAGTTEDETGRYWWGPQVPESVNALQPVTAGLANPWGLYGMTANAWEWLADQHHPDYIGAPSNGAAWCLNPASTQPQSAQAANSATSSIWHQVRGGSWSTPPDATGLAMRASHPAHWRSPFIGFRIARWTATV